MPLSRLQQVLMKAFCKTTGIRSPSWRPESRTKMPKTNLRAAASGGCFPGSHREVLETIR